MVSLVAVVYVSNDEGVVSKSMFKRFVMLCGVDHDSVHHLIVVQDTVGAETASTSGENVTT
jgi:hypothetical protein